MLQEILYPCCLPWLLWPLWHVRRLDSKRYKRPPRRMKATAPITNLLSTSLAFRSSTRQTGFMSLWERVFEQSGEEITEWQRRHFEMG